MKNGITPASENKEGLHYGGAARFALNFGAVIGIGEGLCGNTYAVQQWERWRKPANIATPDLTYLVTPIGCGIAGYTPEEIAPLFRGIVGITNIHLPESFWKIIHS